MQNFGFTYPFNFVSDSVHGMNGSGITPLPQVCRIGSHIKTMHGLELFGMPEESKVEFIASVKRPICRSKQSYFFLTSCLQDEKLSV